MPRRTGKTAMHAYLEKVFNRTYDHSAQETEIRLIGMKSVYTVESRGYNQDAELMWVQFFNRHRIVRHRATRHGAI